MDAEQLAYAILELRNCIVENKPPMNSNSKSSFQILTLEHLIMATVYENEVDDFQIMLAIESVTAKQIPLRRSFVHATLNSLKRTGLVESRLCLSNKGDIQVYKLTSEGIKRLEESRNIINKLYSLGSDQES